MTSHGSHTADPLMEVCFLYTQLKLIAAYHEHPNRVRAERAAHVLARPILEAGLRPKEPDVDPVFGPSDNPPAVCDLDARFGRLHRELIGLGRLADAHVVNRAWTELDLVDPERCMLPWRDGTPLVKAGAWA